MIKRVSGTQDILDMSLYDRVVSIMKEHFNHANYAHIQTPILEYSDLFIRSVGTETDIVSKEMYTFSVNEKETLCLRPEATAAITRAYIGNNITEKPWNVYTYGPIFRHERPQKGRYRQFSQFNIESIGITHVGQDALFLAQLDTLFAKMINPSAYTLSINYLGGAADRAEYKVVLKKYVSGQLDTICNTCKTRVEKNLLRIFDCKNSTCQEVYSSAPIITDHLTEKSYKQWEQLNNFLDALSISRVHNPHLVRGLDYYNNIVFEFSSSLLGAQSAFCGGGQYNLAPQIGHKSDAPAIGAGIGIDRLLIMLEAAGSSIIKNNNKKPLHLVIPFSEEQDTLALILSQSMHALGLNTQVLFSHNVKKAFSKGNKVGARTLILLGEDEQQNSTATIKDMISGDSNTVAHAKLAEVLKEL